MRETVGDQSEPVHDPLKYAIRWCRAVRWQANRLRDALAPPGPEVGVRPGFFDRIAIEQHFTLTAVGQLIRSLDAMGTELRLSEPISERARMLRNVREHWDEWERDKGSQKKFREQWPDGSPYTLGRSNQDLHLGGIISVAALETAVGELLSELLAKRAEG